MSHAATPCPLSVLAAEADVARLPVDYRGSYDAARFRALPKK